MVSCNSEVQETCKSQAVQGHVSNVRIHILDAGEELRKKRKQSQRGLLSLCLVVVLINSLENRPM